MPPASDPAAPTSPERAGAQGAKGRARGLAAALFVAFASLGVVGSTVPASMPGIAARLGVDAGGLLPGVSFLFFGLLAGVLVAAASRSRASTLLLLGLALHVVGLVLIASSASAPMFFVATVIAGVGFGLVEASATALTRAQAAAGTPARLAMLNGASAVAAAGAPLLIAVVPLEFLTATVVAIAAIPASGLLIAVASRSEWPEAPVPRAAARSPRPHRRLLFLGAAIFLFVGAETILSGWSSVLPQALLALPPAFAALGTSAFWILMAAGRFAAAVAVRRGVPARVYFVGASVLAALLVAGAGLVADAFVSALLLGVVVLLVAPGYALLLGSALTGVSASAAGRTTGWLIAVGSAGGALISFAVATLFGARPVAVLLGVGALLLAAAAVAGVPRDVRALN